MHRVCLCGVYGLLCHYSFGKADSRLKETVIGREGARQWDVGFDLRDRGLFFFRSL